MSNITEFNRSTTNTKSLLFDGYFTFNPAQPAAVTPDFVIAIGADGAIDFANGVLSFRDGDASASTTRKLNLIFDKIKPATAKGVLGAAATTKVVTVDVAAIDYAYSNPNGISALYVSGWEGRDIFRQKSDYVVEYPASANVSQETRVAELVKRINLDANRKYNAAVVANGSGSGAANTRIQLTALKPGTDYAVEVGPGFAAPVVVTPGTTEFGTSKFLFEAGVPAYSGAYTGKIFKVAMFTYQNDAILAGDGAFRGRGVNNNAYANEDMAVMIFIENGAADALATKLSNIIAGSYTPASAYNAKSAALTFA